VAGDDPRDDPRGDTLDEYRRKRDFRRTAEPAASPEGGRGVAPATDGERLFVVQRHRARRLHYDVRLEVDGALASWAVPKGPTLDPSVRSLAVHVEDHPMEYADFEGVIPSGEYGGGDVIVWDRGTWEPSGSDDPAAAIAGGELHFDVTSEKLAGRFVLVRTDRGPGGRAARPERPGEREARPGREQWLLLHKNDEHARPGWDPEDHPRSVKSGRTNDEVAADPEALWRSDLPADEAEVSLGAAGDGAWVAPTRGELAALGRLGDAGEWRLGDRDVRLAHLDTEVTPGREGGGRGAGSAVTRRDLVRHYATVAPALLPYLAGRPSEVLRFPRGVEGRSAWRTSRPRGAPGWLEGWPVDDDVGRGAGWRAVLDSAAALAWMAADGTVELRPWPSRIVDLDRPTWAVLGIEPADPKREDAFAAVVDVARLVRTALEHLGLESRPVAPGTTGLEVWLPVRPGPTFRQARAWARSLAAAVGATLPELVPGVVDLDHARTRTDPPPAAPWSVRAAAGAPVVVPLAWDDLDDARLRPDGWTLTAARRRLSDAGDPLAPLAGRAQDLPPL
jgi:bifunctional non-homologous end joining protein LigD